MAYPCVVELGLHADQVTFLFILGTEDLELRCLEGPADSVVSQIHGGDREFAGAGARRYGSDERTIRRREHLRGGQSLSCHSQRPRFGRERGGEGTYREGRPSLRFRDDVAFVRRTAFSSLFLVDTVVLRPEARAEAFVVGGLQLEIGEVAKPFVLGRGVGWQVGWNPVRMDDGKLAFGEAEWLKL